ncbi:hypothetical protein VT84_30040 [Gemmata sp. SH-PL17]|uniref:ABC transporter permease n=1 Tax=Gemmata sp. SH-PL17 TaxID=1630693 RepID=UPI00078BDA50|nr:ABC transporter permease [Gemmata sp. SH-PL17]AMV28684.1 hypothetical protein VT84_30040 [Gemmata sp. SH-PL17]
MRKTTTLGLLVALSAALVIGCAGDSGKNIPPDEALARVRKYGGEYGSLGKGADAKTWEKAAYEYYRPASLNYFEDMDAMGTTDVVGAKKLALSPEAIKGRNAWVIWTAGNEAWWNWLAQYGYGTIDLLKLVDHTNRNVRFNRTGLMNEPATRPPTDAETEKTYGVRFARPGTTDSPAPGGKIHVEYRKDRDGWHPSSSFDPEKPYSDGGYNKSEPEHRYPVYGYPSGVVGLRLFPNPDFTKDAAARWNPKLYYEDSDEGRKYAKQPDTIRPYRVGMSCGFCHIAPHPLNPPADANAPEWANLSNNIGNQFMRIRAVFGNTLKPDNYLYHVFDSQLPGAVDTSGYPSDNNNNPNTINSFFGLAGRLNRAQHIPKETISADTLTYLRTYVDPKFESPRNVPRVLLDGSDSVGVHIALSRVYLNIGTHHQQWIRTQNPLIGFRKQEPFKLHDIAENSLYWHATLLRIDPMAAFFTASTDPMRLKDVVRPAAPNEAQALDKLLKENLRGTGLPWYTAAKTEPEPKKDDAKKDVPPKKAEPEKSLPIVGGAGDYAKGRQVFAKGCIACHSSVQPGDLIYLEQKLVAGPGRERLPALGELPPDWEMRPPAEREQLLAKALAPRQTLRLTEADRARLTRGDGELPPAYKQWADAAVHYPEFWEYTAKVRDKNGQVVKDGAGKEQATTVHNFLSIDERVSITLPHTNSGRAVATNALHGNVWEDFASETYKELAPVGAIRYHDPFSGAEKTYTPPGGGPGYYRVPTLISIWATAPFLHNNSRGMFNNDPSAAGRLKVFDDAIARHLSPELNRVPSKQVYWSGEGNERTIDDGWYSGKSGDQVTDTTKSAARRATDNGWIWRTTDESWLQFEGPHVPTLVGGVLGLSPFWMSVLPWVPALAFLLLGILLLLSERLIVVRERYFAWLWWLLAPIWWIVGFVGIVLAIGGTVFALHRFWPFVMLLDVATQESIWGLRFLAVVLPFVLFGSLALLFTIHRIRAGSPRRRIGQFVGAVCLVLALVSALSFGRFLSGRGEGVRLGPIPEGVPINIIANTNPNATREQKLEALTALTDFFLKYRNVKPGASEGNREASKGEREARRIEFEQTVGPALLRASKCPDYVTDRGHDYEFIRHLTAEEKAELIALLKTF